jgi:hypothetical protein
VFIGDVGEDGLWLFPAGFPHSIQGLGPDGTEFLLVVNQGNIAGKGRMTVMLPVDNARTMDFNANDVGYVPSYAPHYIDSPEKAAQNIVPRFF